MKTKFCLLLVLIPVVMNLFVIAHAEEIVIDDTEATRSDGWSYGPYGGINGEFYQSNDPNDRTVTWTPDISASGYYEVFVHWGAHPLRASNSPYTINFKPGTTTSKIPEAGTGAVVEVDNSSMADGSVTLRVNQRATSDGTIVSGDANSGWLRLGIYYFETGTSGNVTLSTNGTGGGNNYVIADAVKFVSYDTSKSSTITGVVKTTLGNYPVSNVTITLDTGDTVTTNNLGIYSIDVAPGTYSITASHDKHETANVTNVIVNAFQTVTKDILLNYIPPEAVEPIIIDDTDFECMKVGDWRYGPFGGINNEFYYNDSPSSGMTASWIPYIHTAGLYEVYIHWGAYPARAANVPYTVSFKPGTTPQNLPDYSTLPVVGIDDSNLANGSITFLINQKAKADGSLPGGDASSGWFKLGVFYLDTGTSGNVTLSTENLSGGSVTVDAAEFATYNAAASIIKGVVKTTLGDNPVPNVTVNLSTGATTTTNTKGEYSFTVTPGTYSLSVNLDKHEPAEITNIIIGSAQTVTKDIVLTYIPPGETDPIIIDENDVECFLTDSWVELSGYGGVNNNVHYCNSLDNQFAKWVPYLYKPGNYEVFVNWGAHPNRAVNAPYTINFNPGTTPFNIPTAGIGAITEVDDSNITIGSITIKVNQKKTANGVTVSGDANSEWLSLGVYYFDPGSSGNIVLSTEGTGGDGNSYVIADGVKFSTYIATRSKINGIIKSSLVNNPVAGVAVTLDNGDTTTTNNQGEYSFSIDSGTYTLTASLDKHETATISDIVVGTSQTVTRDILLSYIPPEQTDPIIVDDRDFECLKTDGWTYGPYGGINGEFFQCNNPDNQTATWIPYIYDAGKYDIYIHWGAHPLRTTNAPFTVNFKQGTTPSNLPSADSLPVVEIDESNLTNGSITIKINQRAKSDGTIVSGDANSGWFCLGTYYLDAGTSGNVTLGTVDTGGGTNYVIADAVKFERNQESTTTMTLPDGFIKKGWNLVSLPAVPADGTPSIVFDGIDMSNASLQLWDNASLTGGGYLIYGIGWNGPIRTGDAYWFIESSEKAISYQAYPNDTTDKKIVIPAHDNAPYWIMVGLPYDKGINCDRILFNISSDTTPVSWLEAGDSSKKAWIEAAAQGFDAVAQGYFTTSCLGAPQKNLLEPWFGYWMLVKTKEELTITFPASQANP